MTTYDLNNLVSFNSKLEDYFTNTTTKAVNVIYENFLSKNISKLKSKDKSVLKDIAKLNINYVLVDNLNFLWNSGFNTNTNNFSTNVLTSFASVNKTNVDKNKKLTKTISKEDKKIARDIRKRDIEEKRKTLKVLNQDILTSDFGQTYLQERNKEIARNFTNTYQEKIFNSINNYLNQRLSITREKNLINHLSFKRLSDLTSEEKAEYINEYNNLADIYGLSVESLATYDSLKFSPKERIRRIAKTELSAAYNLARYDELVSQGYTQFQVKNSGRPDCVLCKSKHNTIITLTEINNIDKGFTDFRGIDTRKDKNAPENTKLLFPPFHPGCRDYLVGISKKQPKDSVLDKLQQASNIYNKVSTINSVIGLGNSLATKFLGLQTAKKQQEEDNLLKLIIASGSIMSMSMMYYFFTTTKLGTEIVENVVDKAKVKASDMLLEGSVKVIESTADTLQDKLKEAVLNKDYIQSSLYETGYKPPTTDTLSQHLNKQQRTVINEQLANDIQKYITKSDLQELLRSVIIDSAGITKLSELGNSDFEQAKLSELEILLNALIVNNKTTNKQKLLQLIYKEEAKVVAKIPLNIKQPDLVLIQKTENKLVTSTTKLERLGTNITKLNNEVKKNKTNYLKDIETLRELDSELTEQLIGIERINSEYNQLLETTTDSNLSKYLVDKIAENNNKTSELRNKLNNISSDLYGSKLDNVDLSLKDDLVTSIRDKGNKYLDFRNTRTSKIKSINKTLDNYKADTKLDKLNVEYIDNKLAQLDILELELNDLNKDSLVLDSILGDYAILSRIDNDTKDLGYTFNNYLNTASKRNKQIANVDNFKETSLTNTATNLDSYKRKLIKAKAKLLNNEEIIEFSKYSKTLCHLKLKNILEKLRKV
jgi:hypothetical protein